MARVCNDCGAEKLPSTVPYVVHESAMARAERHNKRMWIIILVLIAALVGSNLAWILYEAQFETVTSTEEIVVDADNNGIANYIGNNGDIYNGEDNRKAND